MLHTRFFSREAEARQAFDEMRAALGRIVGAIPRTDDPDCKKKSSAVTTAIAEFAELYA